MTTVVLNQGVMVLLWEWEWWRACPHCGFHTLWLTKWHSAQYLESPRVHDAASTENSTHTWRGGSQHFPFLKSYYYSTFKYGILMISLICACWLKHNISSFSYCFSFHGGDSIFLPPQLVPPTPSQLPWPALWFMLNQLFAWSLNQDLSTAGNSPPCLTVRIIFTLWQKD